jgi:hypothetical protein
MLLTVQGYFEAGKFVTAEPIKIPEHKKAILTILEEEPPVKATGNNALTAFLNFTKFTKTLPGHFDYKKELTEAKEEKYGCFN